jgi:hypothetical protein
MSRSAKATSRASEAAGDGGMGEPKGITNEMEEFSRMPRCVK